LQWVSRSYLVVSFCVSRGANLQWVSIDWNAYGTACTEWLRKGRRWECLYRAGPEMIGWCALHG
jgi:hypothetical protein